MVEALFQNRQCGATRDTGGFTLIELISIIILLGILAAVALPRLADMSDASRIAATQQELAALREAISGSSKITAGGEIIDRGFEGDVGFVPSSLEDLVVKPDSVASYDPLTRLGWNGPYIDSTGGNYLTDAWGTAYTYDPGNRSITATGGDDDIAITF